MRTVLILLLLANLSLFAYTRLDTFNSGEGNRLAEQVQPDKIRLLTREQVAELVAAANTAGPASTSETCLEWGPIVDADRPRAQNDLASLSLPASQLTQRRSDGDSGFWAILAPFPTRAAAESRVSDVRARGVNDVTVVDMGRGQFAVSLGVFRTESGANARVDQMTQRGIAGVKASPRPSPNAQTTVVVRDPPPPVVAKLRELLPSYPGSEIKVAACDKG